MAINKKDSKEAKAEKIESEVAVDSNQIEEDNEFGEEHKKFGIVGLLEKNSIMAGIFTTVALFLMFYSLNLTSVAIVNVLAATEPIFTLMISCFFLGVTEKINSKIVMIVLFIVLGIAMIIS